MDRSLSFGGFDYLMTFTLAERHQCCQFRTSAWNGTPVQWMRVFDIILCEKQLFTIICPLLLINCAFKHSAEHRALTCTIILTANGTMMMVPHSCVCHSWDITSSFPLCASERRIQSYHTIVLLCISTCLESAICVHYRANENEKARPRGVPSLARLLNSNDITLYWEMLVIIAWKTTRRIQNGYPNEKTYTTLPVTVSMGTLILVVLPKCFVKMF